ncbi:hypothetical protein Krac_4885 [Ktedonobacter racemifer DSM 44963]|uniref:Uncharacterized protein n=1 Tax=Ktedonobacter racemifer DSM 44963 TaxID=485913 RepID=D6TTY1_KTERA|nr:hypothetical protein Krac_4885 [Ktedonobacter racemifer DSM 44963]
MLAWTPRPQADTQACGEQRSPPQHCPANIIGLIFKRTFAAPPPDMLGLFFKRA